MVLREQNNITMRLVAVIVQKHVFFLRAKFMFKWPRVHEEHITFLGKSGSLIKVAHMKGALRGSEYHDIAKIIKHKSIKTPPNRKKNRRNTNITVFIAILLEFIFSNITWCRIIMILIMTIKIIWTMIVFKTMK